MITISFSPFRACTAVKLACTAALCGILNIRARICDYIDENNKEESLDNRASTRDTATTKICHVCPIPLVTGSSCRYHRCESSTMWIWAQTFSCNAFACLHTHAWRRRCFAAVRRFLLWRTICLHNHTMVLMPEYHTRAHWNVQTTTTPTRV